MRHSCAVLALLVFGAGFPAAGETQTAGNLRIVVIAGEDAVNVIQQRTAVAPIVEVRDRNNQPVAGAVVRFSVQSGRATFSGARTLTVTTDIAGRAAAGGLTPTGAGAVQITASAASQGQTAAIAITQTNVMTAAEAAQSAAAGSGASGTGAGAGAAGGATATGVGAAGAAVAAGAAGAGAAGGGLSGVAIGAIAAAAGGGTVVAVKAAGGGSNSSGSTGSSGSGSSGSGPSPGPSGGNPTPTPGPTGPTTTTYSGPFSAQLMVASTTSGNNQSNTCVSTRAITGTLTIALTRQSDGTLTGDGRAIGTQTEIGVTASQFCQANLGTVPFNTGGAVSGPPDSLTFSQQTTASSSGPIAAVTVTNTTTFAGALGNGVISGTITYSEMSSGQQLPPNSSTIRGSGSTTFPVTLR